MCRSPNRLIVMILMCWHVPMRKSLDFEPFKNLACADIEIASFEIVRIWFVQELKSLEFKYVKDLECAEAHIIRFQCV